MPPKPTQYSFSDNLRWWVNDLSKLDLKNVWWLFLQMTGEAILRLVSDPVLPFYPLDIVLDIQNKLKGNRWGHNSGEHADDVIQH